ncbi:YokU family protein [Rossellomorea aquimaris]|uniref:Putative YokU family protein n=1 Tax=Rossellomorea aquimaris TaxID=189382 RepID=A0A366EFB6_9BACI|nr:YokU family protein [Rossellomorea aquimaris]RBP01094.1 putative YokU family protein [Rossellomorea aquimaris]
MDKNNAKVCEWCEEETAHEEKANVYWELPDGSRAIQISNVPSMSCSHCGMEYQEEAVINEIEDQLMLIDTKLIDKVIAYTDLMELPRLLKKNYFRY